MKIISFNSIRVFLGKAIAIIAVSLCYPFHYLTTKGDEICGHPECAFRGGTK